MIYVLLGAAAAVCLIILAAVYLTRTIKPERGGDEKW